MAAAEIGAQKPSMTQKIITLEGVVGLDVYKKAGLSKLTRDEQRVLQEFIERYGKSIAQSVENDCKSGKIRK